jgi:PemK-like, MazF-like toxin of type II toxin-antitoxin system
MQQDADPRPIRGGAFDYRGPAIPEYAPEADHEPDPGEVVWAWVPFEEDTTQGKDRPLAIVGRSVDKPGDMVCFLLSSKDRSDDEEWVLIGSGEWDQEHRPSWVNIARPLAVNAEAVRREGGSLSREQFDAVVEAARRRFPPHE